MKKERNKEQGGRKKEAWFRKLLNRARFSLVLVPYSFFLFPCSFLLAVSDGYVVRVDSSTVYLDWGAASGIKRGDTFQTYVAGAELKHPVSGQILGQTKTMTGSGFVTDIQDNYSLGRITGWEGEGPKSGQRTAVQREAPAIAAAVQTPAAPAAAATATAFSSSLRELYRSQPYKGEANGLAVGDIDGDGKKELIVAFRDRLEVFRWDGQKLGSLTIHKNRSDRGWLTVETADLQGTGKDLIFAACVPPYAGARGKTVVFSFQNGGLQEIARGDGFIRRIDRMGGQSTLIWQGLSMSRQTRVLPPAAVHLDGKKIKAGEALKLPRSLNDDQLLGITFGDWDNDAQEDLALLQGGERLRLFFSATPALADPPGRSGGKGAPWSWSAPESYGGTKALIPMEDEAVAWVYPRLKTRLVTGGVPQLLVPRNIPKLGIRTTYMKFFDRSEIVALAWNGLEMAPLWRLPLQAYLADFIVDDLTGSGKSQIWTVTHAPGNKAVVLAFDLP